MPVDGFSWPHAQFPMGLTKFPSSHDPATDQEHGESCHERTVTTRCEKWMPARQAEVNAQWCTAQRVRGTKADRPSPSCLQNGSGQSMPRGRRVRDPALSLLSNLSVEETPLPRARGLRPWPSIGSSLPRPPDVPCAVRSPHRRKPLRRAFSRALCALRNRSSSADQGHPDGEFDTRS